MLTRINVLIIVPAPVAGVGDPGSELRVFVFAPLSLLDTQLSLC
jgi:hypothetical protein